MNYIILLGAFQALVALMLFNLYGNKGGKPAYTILKCLLACLVVHLSLKFTIYVLQDNQLVKAGFNTFLDFAYGPLLWLYCQKVSNGKLSVKKQWPLMLPTLVAGICYAFLAVNMVLHNPLFPQWLALYNKATGYLILVSFLFYAVKAGLHARSIPAFWQLEQQLVKRIAVIFLINGLLGSLMNLVINFHLMNLASADVFIRVIAYTGLLIVSLLIIQYQLRTQQQLSMVEADTAKPIALAIVEPVIQEAIIPVIAPVADSLLPDIQETILSAAPEKASLLSSQQYAIITEKLLHQMEVKKLYKDSQLTLEKLAAVTDTPRNHVSETLNQHLDKPFYQFINEFRVAEVIHLWNKYQSQHSPQAILSIAFEAGFHSKTTFNQYFKKVTGLTPSEYLKQGKSAPVEHDSASVFSVKNVRLKNSNNLETLAIS